jgi:uncharacterized protein YejL (UPF0352 family)
MVNNVVQSIFAETDSHSMDGSVETVILGQVATHIISHSIGNVNRILRRMP